MSSLYPRRNFYSKSTASLAWRPGAAPRFPHSSAAAPGRNAQSAAEETPPLAVEPAPPVEPVDADEAKKDAGEEEDAGVVAAKRKNGPDADNTAVEPASKAAKTAAAAADTAAEATAA